MKKKKLLAFILAAALTVGVSGAIGCNIVGTDKTPPPGTEEPDPTEKRVESVSINKDTLTL